MASVVSLGSVNVDHVVAADEALLSDLAARYDWFPAAGETVTVDSVPDRVRDLDADHLLGGKGANQAVAVARAGGVGVGAGDAGAGAGGVPDDAMPAGGNGDPEEVTAALLGRVGEDADEYAIRPTLADRGVDVSGVEATDGPTGAAYVFVDENAENRIAVVPGANDAVDERYVARHREAVLAADALLLQNEIPVGSAESLLADLDDRRDRPDRRDQPERPDRPDHPDPPDHPDRPTVVLDPAPAERVEPLLAHDCVDVVTPNESEAESLADALASFDGTVVRTRGSADVLVESAEGGEFAVTPPTVEAVDTTGAGDVFAGYLAAGLASGAGLRVAAERATVAAALSVTAKGVQRATPTLEEVRAFDIDRG